MWFTKKLDAEKWAVKRKAGFRSLANKTKNDPTRKKFLLDSIKTVKVRTVKRKHWKRPLYEVTGN